MQCIESVYLQQVRLDKKGRHVSLKYFSIFMSPVSPIFHIVSTVKLNIPLRHTRLTLKMILIDESNCDTSIY